MARSNDFLRAFLMDVIAQGFASMDKRKLIWLLGKQQDRPQVWADLLSAWEDEGMDRKALSGAEYNGRILLIYNTQFEFDSVETWAGE